MRETYILFITAMQVGLNGQVSDRGDLVATVLQTKFPPSYICWFFSCNLILDSLHLQDAIPTTFSRAKKNFQENSITSSERYPGLARVAQMLCCAQGTGALSCTSQARSQTYAVLLQGNNRQVSRKIQTSLINSEYVQAFSFLCSSFCRLANT